MDQPEQAEKEKTDVQATWRKHGWVPLAEAKQHKKIIDKVVQALLSNFEQKNEKKGVRSDNKPQPQHQNTHPNTTKRGMVQQYTRLVN